MLNKTENYSLLTKHINRLPWNAFNQTRVGLDWKYLNWWETNLRHIDWGGGWQAK